MSSTSVDATLDALSVSLSPIASMMVFRCSCQPRHVAEAAERIGQRELPHRWRLAIGGVVADALQLVVIFNAATMCADRRHRLRSASSRMTIARSPPGRPHAIFSTRHRRDRSRVRIARRPRHLAFDNPPFRQQIRRRFSSCSYSSQCSGASSCVGVLRLSRSGGDVSVRRSFAR